ncbi:MAG: diacylglycerol kinase family protein [Actinomycetota bacterium]
MSGVFLLVNPARTRRRGVDEAIRSHLDRLGHTVEDIRPTGIDDVAPAITRALAADPDPGAVGGSEGATATDPAAAGTRRLLIAGGDGLVHHALPALAGADLEVGIVGVGTGNDFARALDLPAKVAAAVDTALGPTTPVDLIAATDHPPRAATTTDDATATTAGTTTDGAAAVSAPTTDGTTTAGAAAVSAPTTDGAAADGAAAGSAAPAYAASVVTGGFSGTVNARANGLRFPPGQQRYTVATLLELPRLEAVEIHLTVDGEEHELSSAMFAVANTRYFGGGMAICPDADPTDGLLDVTVVGPVGALTLARVLPTVFSGRHVTHPKVTTYRGAEVRIATDSDLWADGEPFGGQTFTAARGVLHVATTL